MTQRFPVIMFDLDGTLFDTAQAITTTFNATFEALGLNQLDDHNIRNTIGLPLEKAFSKLLCQPEEESIIVSCVDEYQNQFRKKILPMAKELLFPGVSEGLLKLKNEQFHLAVNTNKFARSANALLTAAGIADLFDVIVCADEVHNKKPAPESGQKILTYLQASKDQALMVGDTTHDIFMANNLGCKSIAVDYGIHSQEELKEANPTWIASNFYRVVNICKQNFSDHHI
ncbi:HAD family hydrolase [Vibrio sagamiensis]|uniref:phosphoglycolate phosphatase n=1 Tax=Vibrio sagamiensis NBRC 104589 TaxID=1219064 RepID=A0A511QJL1_9VIBR|nr:HAD family hydrolase [Vibrio sagamiensis]PNQ54037.1 HAD family hydrolase [Vibrio agarivorans]GEM77479.1 hydrolase [Vibrio sagamiensis NBRC 104589]